MSTKLSAEQSKKASELLGRLDKIAGDVQANYTSMGMTQEDAKRFVNAVDKMADELESHFYGQDSLQRRALEIAKQAKVIQKDSDESYMDTFNNPSKPRQTDGDEPYMSAYADDDTAGVNAGKSTTGRPLAP